MSELRRFAVLEGQPTGKIGGWRHYAIINPNLEASNKRRIVFNIARPKAARRISESLQARFYAAGTWETEFWVSCIDLDPQQFPPISDSVQNEIFGTAQADLV